MLHGGVGADVMDGGLGPDETGPDEGLDDHDVASLVEITATLDTDTGLCSVGLVFQEHTGGGEFDHVTSAGDESVRVEEIHGANYDDVMTGTGDDDYYVGARGEDVVIANAGEDTLYGSLDDDVIYAGSAVPDAQNSVVSSSNDGESDILIFLRYNTDGVAGDDPSARGDGDDMVYNFNAGAGAGSDSILFLVNETFTPTAELVAEGTLITCASDSTSLLDGVYDADPSTVDIQFEMITLQGHPTPATPATHPCR